MLETAASHLNHVWLLLLYAMIDLFGRFSVVDNAISFALIRKSFKRHICQNNLRLISFFCDVMLNLPQTLGKAATLWAFSS